MSSWSRGWFFVARAARRHFRVALSKTPGAAVGIALTFAFVWASTNVTREFGDVVGEMERQRELHKPDRTGELAGELFGELTRGLPDRQRKPIDFDRNTSRLRVNVDCAGWNAGFPAPEDRDTPEPLRNALALFCQSDVGAALRGEIDAWNAPIAMAAIRDDWDGLGFCKDRSKPNGYIRTGCHPNAWSGAITAGTRHTARGPLGEAPSPSLFGFLAMDQHEGFGDWTRFDASGIRSDEGALELYRGFPAEAAGGRARTITVDVVGDVEEASWRDEHGQIVQQLGLGRLLCEAAETEGECNAAVKRDGGGAMPRAHRLVVELPPGARDQLTIRVKPISVSERRVSALFRAEFRIPSADERPLPRGMRINADGIPVETIRFTAHIEAQCSRIRPSEDAVFNETLGRMELRPRDDPKDEPKAEPICALFWDGGEEDGPPPPTVPVATGLFGVAADSAHEKVPLSESYELGPLGAGGGDFWVAANAEARRLGLLPVVGFDGHDPNSLLGRLHEISPPGGNVEADLTIDADLQGRVNGLVNGLTGDRADLAAVRSHLPAEWKSKRRVAIVLLDAGLTTEGGGYDDGAGRILAAATYPQVRKVLSQWDLLALDAHLASQDPIAARAWAKSDRFNAAGSTFKSIIALAAIDKAARGDMVLTQMLGAEPGQRGLDAAGMASVLGKDYGFGWEATELNVPAYGRSVPLHNAFGDKEPVSAAAIANGSGPPTVSLSRAMALSNNLWFARLALATDAPALASRTPDGHLVENANARDDGDLAIVRMVDRLWPKEARALVAGFSPRLGYASRLQADPIAIDETGAGQSRLLHVALAGYGEGGVQVTSLAMASAMASIACGRIVEPRLTPMANPDAKLRGAPLFDPAPVGGRPLDAMRAAKMLETLRAALAAVVRQNGGTAYEAFLSNGALAGRVHGKTGTATVGGRIGDLETNYNTVWFEGWIDGLRNTRFVGRRIAFACMVTHADRAGGTAGGTVCAPLMRQLFEEIERSAATPATANSEARR